MMEEPSYRATRILKALGNPLRARILERIAEAPVSPTDLAHAVRRSISVVSRTLQLLRVLDLVCYVPRHGRLVYQLKHDYVRVLLAVARQCARVVQAVDAGRPGFPCPPPAPEPQH